MKCFTRSLALHAAGLFSDSPGRKELDKQKYENENRSFFLIGELHKHKMAGGAWVGRWKPKVDGAHAVHTLSAIVAQKTIAAREQQDMDYAPFAAVHELLKQAYPALFSAAHAQAVADGSLLILLPGAQKKRPLLFLGHLDVRPVEEDNLSLWEVPPYSGNASKGYVYGCGAWEGKGRIIALCEAAESLLVNGWQPSADIWFAFSNDAQVYGTSAKQMCRILQSQGVEPAFILDGGGAVEGRFAKIGVAEKGYADITLTTTGNGGYAAKPEYPIDLEKLFAAGAYISKSKMKPKLSPPVEWMLKALAPHMPFFKRFIFSRPQLFLPILARMRRDKDIHPTSFFSTIVPTQVKAGPAPDMMARHHTLTYHCRLLPGDTVEKVIAQIRNAIGALEIRIAVQGAERPSGLSPAQGATWEAMATAIQILFPDAVTIPCLVEHTTDARCYEELGGNIYRFSPFRMGQGDGPLPVNERISLENLELGIQFYQQMLQA